jgi:ABC-type multidrug transport system fused ATPase/permease subunit
MSPLRGLLTRLLVDRSAVARAAALQSLQSLTYLPLSAGVGWLVDHVLARREGASAQALLPSVGTYLAANLALYALHAAITVQAFAASQTVARGASARLRADVVDRLFSLRLSFVERRGAGVLAHRLTSDVAQIESFVSLLASRLVPSVILGLAALAYLAITEPALAALTLLAVPLSLALSLRAEKRLERLADTARGSGETFASAIVETTLGLRHLRSVGADLLRRRAIEGDIERVRTTGLDAGIAMTRAALTLQAVSDLLPVAVWSAGGVLFLYGWVSMGSLVAFVALLVFVQGALGTVTEAHRTWALTRPAWAATRALLALDEAALDPSAVAHAPVQPLDGSIALEGVRVQHEGAREAALDGVSLVVAAGERIAILGPSGAGKSTLLDVLAGLAPPTAGTVRWSGKTAAELGRASLRAAIAVAPQEAFLFRTTLRENVRMGRLGATDDDIERACRRAGLAPLLTRLPEGLETPIDERGQNLSGGERQRLAIARLFLRDPRIVILDEPTSALDDATEAAVLPELEALFEGRTSIVVTHRPALAARASRVLTLAAGRIARDEVRDREEGDPPAAPRARR